MRRKVVLASLVELSIPFLPLRAISRLIAPSSTPSIRAVALHSLGISAAEASNFLHSLPLAATSRLDVLSLNMNTLSTTYDATGHRSVPFLHRYHIHFGLGMDNKLLSPLPANIRLYIITLDPRYDDGEGHEENAATVAKLLGTLADAYRTLRPPLEQPYPIILPHQLPTWFIDYPSAQAAFSALVAACEAKGVQMWKEQEESHLYDSLVSPSFWEYSRRIKRGEGAVSGDV
jgi:hypothetical protein